MYVCMIVYKIMCLEWILDIPFTLYLSCVCEIIPFIATWLVVKIYAVCTNKNTQ